ncbi:MAG: hypothetical protein OCD02_00515 [Spirochaetaceae bacterium]
MDIEFEQRKEAWIKKSLEAKGDGPFSEIVRIHMGLPVKIEPLDQRLKMMEDRVDCADFHAAGFIRMIYQFFGSDSTPEYMKEKIVDTILAFKYWPDEPGDDDMCTWSENHTILFSSAAYLAGLKFPDRIFLNSGLTGTQMAKKFLPRVKKWLDIRFATGFSEWLSNVYYNEDFPAIANLIDFAGDEEIKTKATMVLDLLLADIALNSYDSIMACSHGRAYEGGKKDGLTESTAPVARLLFGGETFADGNFSAVSLIFSTYKMPGVIKLMAHNHKKEVDENNQICGFNIEDAKDVGLDIKRIEDGMMFVAGEAYMHPKFFAKFLKLLDAYNWWDNKFFSPFKPFRGFLKFLKATGLLAAFAKLVEKDTTRGYRGAAHIYTYRTPYYQMGATQNYRVGYGGDQQSPWQVTLGGNATCFVTHPGKAKTLVENDTPNYWTGAGTQPGVVQYKNCALMIYNTNTTPGLYITNRELYTHAWLPLKEFDQVVEDGHWKFTQKDDSYLALWSRNETQWGEEGDGRCDLIAQGKKNIWISQAGDKDEWGTFQNFIQKIQQAKLTVNRLNVTFDSPGNGELNYKWKGDLKYNGKKVELKGNYRYNNKFSKAKYPAEKINFRADNMFLNLDYNTGERTYSDE